MYILRLLSLIFYFTCSASAWAQTRDDELARQNITEATLKNGLRVSLKHSEQEPGQFSYQLFAIGGYSSLPAADHPSAELAADVAWESGLNQLSGDALDCLLDDHRMDMRVMIGLFERQIEAAGPSEELPLALKLSRLLFTNPQFNQEGFKNAIHQKRHQLKKKALIGLKGREVSLKINTRNWCTVSPFNVLDLDKVEIRKTQSIFKDFFSNPAEFMLVIVGDINPKTTLTLLEKTLGSLPRETLKHREHPKPPAFPEGIAKKTITGFSLYKKCYTRMTFPLSPHTVDPVALDLFCTVLKKRLQKDAGAHEKWKKEIRINCQHPLFPSVEPIWLVVKFTGSSAEIEPNCKTIVKLLDQLKNSGVSEKEISSAYEELMKLRSLPMDNSCELELLANYYRAGWDILKLFPQKLKKDQEKTMLKNMAECYPNLEQYSIISFYP